MNTMLGGIIIATPPLAAIKAEAKPLSYPAFIMAGIRIAPSAATVAGPEPDTAPQNRETITVAIAKPPGTSPTTSSTNRIILREMPARSITSPASTKKGTANNVNLEIPENIIAGYISKGSPNNIMVRIVESPRATAIGMLASISPKKESIKTNPISIYTDPLYTRWITWIDR